MIPLVWCVLCPQSWSVDPSERAGEILERKIRLRGKVVMDLTEEIEEAKMEERGSTKEEKTPQIIICYGHNKTKNKKLNTNE